MGVPALIPPLVDEQV
jgi:hypothetical protein